MTTDTIVASHLHSVKPSASIAAKARADAMRAAGREIIDFTVGEPDFPTPIHIVQAGVDALYGGATRYVSSAGMPILRKAIVQKLQRENGIEFQDSQVVVGCGAKHVIFNALSASLILCDVAGRRGTMHSRIKALHPSMTVCGPAFTVEVRPGDNLMFHVALAVAKPGDVIVVDGKNDSTCALFGDLMVTQAAAAKLGGFVVDAASRDTASLANGEFPVFSTGANPCGPTKGLPGRLCIPVAVGGVSVSPGDLVVGDVDGVVVIPRNELAAVLDAAEKKVAAEQQRLHEIAQGILVSPWLDDALRQAGLAPL